MGANAKIDDGRRASKEALVAGLETKSDKIRSLARAGYSRTEIADFLGVRYQFVRNVLVNDQRIAAGRSDPATGREPRVPAVANLSSDSKPYPRTAQIEVDGRIAVPAEFLIALGLNENDPVILSLDNDALRMMSLPASVRRVQAMVRRVIPEGVSLVDELIAERRAEAKREDDND